ncbi:MAG: hypothetical protein ABR616_18345 [Dermatophilaceae bacterium]
MHESTTSPAVPPRPPGKAIRDLERLLDREAQRLDTRRSELTVVRDAIRGLSREMTRSAVVPVAGLEIIPVDMAVVVLAELMDEAGEGVVRTVARVVDYGAGLEDERVRDRRQRLADGRERRAIYPLSALDSAAGRRWVGAWAEAGESQRFVPEPPSEFLVAGTTAVFACAEWNVPQSDYVVIREPMLVAAFTALHELSYSTGTALGAELGAGLPDSRLVDLLALGLKDEAVARILGWSLRTVRRRIAGLMDEQGVETRFQLGAALLARGRLEAGPLPLSPIRATVSAARRR